jgi:hypothetical protein
VARSEGELRRCDIISGVRLLFKSRGSNNIFLLWPCSTALNWARFAPKHGGKGSESAWLKPLLTKASYNTIKLGFLVLSSEHIKELGARSADTRLQVPVGVVGAKQSCSKDHPNEQNSHI